MPVPMRPRLNIAAVLGRDQPRKDMGAAGAG